MTNNQDKNAIIQWANKGMNLLQIHKRFTGITITEIKDICNNHYLENKNEYTRRSNPVIKTLNNKRNRKDRVHAVDVEKRTPSRISNRIEEKK